MKYLYNRSRHHADWCSRCWWVLWAPLNMIRDLCQRTGNRFERNRCYCHRSARCVVWRRKKLRSNQLIKTLARNSKITINDLLVISDAEIALEGVLAVIMNRAYRRYRNNYPGKIKDGEIVRSGGWGIELDDEGSGAWIGRTIEMLL